MPAIARSPHLWLLKDGLAGPASAKFAHRITVATSRPKGQTGNNYPGNHYPRCRRSRQRGRRQRGRRQPEGRLVPRCRAATASSAAVRQRGVIKAGNEVAVNDSHPFPMPGEARPSPHCASSVPQPCLAQLEAALAKVGGTSDDWPHEHVTKDSPGRYRTSSAGCAGRYGQAVSWCRVATRTASWMATSTPSGVLAVRGRASLTSTVHEESSSPAISAEV